MDVSTWAFRLAVSLAAAVIVAQPTGARTLNGFDLSDASIPPDEIFRGGPPRDGIPALTNPDYITANEASFLEDRDRVLGVAINGTPHAYPVGIMNHHEIVNHASGGSQWLITYCPLCGTGMVFEATVNGEP